MTKLDVEKRIKVSYIGKNGDPFPLNEFEIFICYTSKPNYHTWTKFSMVNSLKTVYKTEG